MRFEALKCLFLFHVHYSFIGNRNTLVRAVLSTSNTSRMTSSLSSSAAKKGMIEATDLFGKWAQTEGRVEKMAAGHTPAVSEMLTRLVARIQEHPSTLGKNNLKFLDIGCGSGWVCRKILNANSYGNMFSVYHGIDGSSDMVLKAKVENKGIGACTFQEGDM